MKERVRRLLADIEKSLSVAKRVVELGEEEFLSDIRNAYTLRLAIVEILEASVSLGLQILKEEEVEGYRQVFGGLLRRGVISPDVYKEMVRLVGLRNLIVHRYWEVDDLRVYREARGSGLKVIERFVEEVGKYAARAGDP